ncbi:MAG TPA: carbon-nitrogen hydrolase, partial [Hyphomonas sp.]|nr:carbon-nitrogen hydrolase [Hyphomonas sp.]
MSNSKAKLIIRNATPDDIPGLQGLSARVYGEGEEYSRDHLMAQINRFPDGQFIAEYEGQIVGHCATFMIASEHAFGPHTWMQITGGGYAARHDPEGDVL